jgi:hypothetical protein
MEIVRIFLVNAKHQMIDCSSPLMIADDEEASIAWHLTQNSILAGSFFVPRLLALPLRMVSRQRKVQTNTQRRPPTERRGQGR